MVDKRKVLLICDSSTSFIVKAIKEGINSAGFNCATVANTMAALSELTEIPELVILYIDENMDRNGDVVFYIRDFCIEEDRKLFLVGYGSDIEDVKKSMSADIVAGCFERPIDAKAIGAELLLAIEDLESAANKKHILVVDDSGTMLRTIREWLSNKYKVSVVNSATSAISFLATNSPDLVLLDYEMPVCSGPMMLEMIRAEQRTAQLPVIFLTSKSDRESVQKVLSLKPDGYLLKSMTADKIIASVDNFFLTQKAKSI